MENVNLYSGISQQGRFKTALQFGGIQVRTTECAETTGELPHQTHLPAVFPVAAVRTSTPSRSRHQFIDPEGMKGLIYLSKCK
jgi:hypothetical protein